MNLAKASAHGWDFVLLSFGQGVDVICPKLARVQSIFHQALKKSVLAWAHGVFFWNVDGICSKRSGLL
jgi:hypothetical protein